MAEPNLGLVITNLPKKQWYTPLLTVPQSLGRGKIVEVRVPTEYRSVSRSHAKIWGVGNTGRVCDTGSANGTSINGVRIPAHREVMIMRGDRVMFGTLEMTAIEPFDDSLPCADDESSVNLHRPLMKQAADLMCLLTHAERDVLLWMSRGLTTPEAVAIQTHRSPHTVRTQLSSIFGKLNVHSRDALMGLLMRASRSGSDSGTTPEFPLIP